MLRDAVISLCGQFRYSLTRDWEDGMLGRVLWVMLNPSTADALQDDPTIGRCIRFSQSWGYNSLAVANAYAYRTPMPRALRGAGYPIGAANDAVLERLAHESQFVVVAWGNLIQPERAAALHALLSPIRPLHALRLTKSGQPSHPLYLPSELRPFEWKAAA